MPLNTLPLEIKSIIADHVDDRDDLLALVLTCQDFAVRCILDVLSWRDIRVRFCDFPELWRYITSSASYARRIRRMTILGRDDDVLATKRLWVTRLPSWFLDGQDTCSKDHRGGDLDAHDVIGDLMASLGRMPCLIALTIGGYTLAAGLVDKMWKIIFESCNSLRELTVLSCFHHSPSAVRCKSFPLFNFKDLTLLRLDFDSDLGYVDVSSKDVNRLLDACPELHTLHLYFSSLDAPMEMEDIIDTRTLPHLTSFGLGRAACTHAVFCPFLRRHPQLKTLDLQRCSIADMPLPTLGDLARDTEAPHVPHLRTFAIPEGGEGYIVAAHAASAPLEEIRGFAFAKAAYWGAPGVAETLRALRGTLRRIVLAKGRNGGRSGSKAFTTEWFQRELPDVEAIWL